MIEIGFERTRAAADERAGTRAVLASAGAYLKLVAVAGAMLLVHWQHELNLKTTGASHKGTS